MDSEKEQRALDREAKLRAARRAQKTERPEKRETSQDSQVSSLPKEEYVASKQSAMGDLLGGFDGVNDSPARDFSPVSVTSKDESSSIDQLTELFTAVPLSGRHVFDFFRSFVSTCYYFQSSLIIPKNASTTAKTPRCPHIRELLRCLLHPLAARCPNLKRCRRTQFCLCTNSRRLLPRRPRHHKLQLAHQPILGSGSYTPPLCLFSGRC